MRYRNIILSLFIFSILIFNVLTPVFINSVIAETVIDSSICNFGYGVSHRNMLVNSTSAFHVIYIIDNNLTHAISNDNGTTWANSTIRNNVDITNYDVCIDSNDKIWLLYGNSTNLYYNITTYTTSWNIDTVIYTYGAYSFFDVAITCDNADNIHVFFSTWDGGGSTDDYLRYIKYNSILQTWGTVQQLEKNDQRSADPQCYKHMGATTTQNGNIHLIYQFKLQHGVDVNIKHFIHTATGWTSSIIDTYSPAISSLSVASFENNLHLVVGESDIYYYNYDGSTWTALYTVYDDPTFTQYFPTISIDYRGDLHALWYGATSETSYTQILGKSYESGMWSDLGYYTIGATDKELSVLMFQRFPQTSMLMDGFMYVYLDNGVLTFSDESTGIFFGGGTEGYEANYPFDVTGLIRVGDMQDHRPFDGNYIDIQDITETYTSYWWFPFINQYFGLYSSTWTDYTTYPFVEIQRNSPTEGLIKHFAIKMLTSWDDVWSGSASDLDLRINGYYCGKATGVYAISNNYDMYYWKDINIDILDDRINVELLSSNQEFRYQLVDADTDIDNDGDREFKFHGDYNRWNGEYDGNNGALIDFVYAFWYEPPDYDEHVQTYDYLLTINPTSVVWGQSTLITYTCPIDHNVQLRILDTITDGFLYDESTIETGITSGTLYYTPSIAHNLNISLYEVATNTYFENKTLTVTDPSTPYQYLIFTNPSTTRPNRNFDICYIYNNSLYDGIITLGGYIFYVFKNTSTIDKISDVSLSAEGTYECRLEIDIPDTNNDLLGDLSYHYVREIHDNELYIKAVVISSGAVGIYTNNGQSFNANNLDLYFVGSHTCYGGNVYIEIAGEILDVSLEPEFELPIPTLSTGSYIAYLKVDGTELARFSFSIVIHEPEDAETILPLVDPMTGAILGGLLTVGFLFIPFFIVSGMEKIKFKVDIPSYVYAITGGTGAIMSTLFGFWGWEVPFFILALGIIGITIMWLAGKRGEG